MKSSFFFQYMYSWQRALEEFKILGVLECFGRKKILANFGGGGPQPKVSQRLTFRF